MILTDLLVVFLVAGAVVFVFQRLRLPSVLGLLVGGLLVGPHGLSLVADAHRVHVLAEIGVVVLLFTVGLEFSLSRLLAMGRMMAQVGAPQIVLCVAATVAATAWHFDSPRQALFAGLLVAMSSTAIVLKIRADRGELGTLHGRLEVAVLLLQDLLVVVAVLLVPLLANDPEAAGLRWYTIPRGIATVAAILAAGKFLVPRVLYQIVGTRNRELFLIAIFVICIGTASLTAWVGLSLALGAFLAGLTLAESEYGHQTLAEVLPFRDTLSSLFFISVGMLLDVRFLASHPGGVLLVVAGLLAIKLTAVVVPALVAGYSLRTSVLSGLALAQIGEFSFVLAQSGLNAKLLGDEEYQTFLAAAVVSMGAAPFLIAAGPRVAHWLSTWPALAALRDERHARHDPAETEHLRDHVIIAGYGLNGRNLARTLRDLQIAYVVLEINPQTVRQQRQLGESILFGDCTRPAVLQHAGLRHARACVLGISDAVSTRRAVQVVRQLSPGVRILVRTRYRSEVEELRMLGADVIVPEEFEASVEVFAQVLREYRVGGHVIDHLVAQLRAANYEALREGGLGREHLRLTQEILGAADTETCLVSDAAPACRRRIGELRIRTLTGASVIAVRRQTDLLANPGADFELQSGDVAVLLGTAPQLAAAKEILLGPTTPAADAGKRDQANGE